MNKQPKKNTKLMKAILTATGIFWTLGAVLVSVPANAVPVPVGTTITLPCNNIAVAADTTCSRYGQVFSQASLTNLTATARIDTTGPNSFTAQASVFYYTEILSSTGVFNDLRIPLLIQANGYTEVGGVPPVDGSGFNNNQAHANFYFGGSNLASACSGAGCSPSAQASFNGLFPVEIVPTADAGDGAGIFRITLQADVNSNSSYLTSYAHAWVDPTIVIDPAFSALHPEYSLAFSANVPQVPIPAAVWLFGSGLLGLIGIARRRVGCAATN